MPRKTPGGILDPPEEAAASMRPRPDAAENRAAGLPRRDHGVLQ